MSRLGRYVGRARGSALRAVGAPRTPNLPSVRAHVQRELRAATDVPTSPLAGRRGATDPELPAARGDRSDRHGGLALALGAVAVALVIYLLTAPGPPPVDRPATTCADRVVWHGSRLQDCYRGEEP